MTLDALHRSIADARSAVAGEVTSTSRVVDSLLDFRVAAGDDPIVVPLIDSILSTIPGRTVVTNDWWLARLDEILGASGSGCPTELSPALP